MAWSKAEMAKIVADLIPENSLVNLGIGMPTMAADYFDPKKNITLHSENGLLGVGPYPLAGEERYSLINAGKETVTLQKGGSIFDSATSFSMIRGGHGDWAVLGALQVAKNGDIANWAIPGKLYRGMGGAMDLCSGVKNCLVMMTHLSKQSEKKLLEKCSFPLTAKAAVHYVLTDWTLLKRDPGAWKVLKKHPDISLKKLKENTEFNLFSETKN